VPAVTVAVRLTTILVVVRLVMPVPAIYVVPVEKST
jgi:hypothetical protein